MNEAAKSMMLMKNCQGLTAIEPKFSASHNSSVAAASKPTTAGRSPVKMACTSDVRMYFRKSLLMSTISMIDGRTSASVAVKLPKTDMASEYWALCTAV